MVFMKIMRTMIRIRMVSGFTLNIVFMVEQNKLSIIKLSTKCCPAVSNGI